MENTSFNFTETAEDMHAGAADWEARREIMVEGTLVETVIRIHGVSAKSAKNRVEFLIARNGIEKASSLCALNW